MLARALIIMVGKNFHRWKYKEKEKEKERSEKEKFGEKEIYD